MRANPYLIGCAVLGNRHLLTVPEVEDRGIIGIIERELGLVGVGAETIPSAGATYTDFKTVLAVQDALKKAGFNPGTLDGKMGPNTAKAIRAMQTSIGIPVTGVIDSGVLMALKVTPGVVPPGVTAASQAEVESEAALNAATAVEHAVTKPDVQNAAAQVVDAAPASPPELRAAAVEAHAAVVAAKTPEQLATAKAQVQQVATQVQAAVAPSFWRRPMWRGAPVENWQGIVGGIAGLAIAGGLAMAVRR